MAVLLPLPPEDPGILFVLKEWLKRIRTILNEFVISIVRTYSTNGSYITAATASGATQVFVRDTSVFSASGGTAVIFDTTNDGDEFTYTGKTEESLTGCSGVLAHNNNASIIPKAKSITISSAVNELRFWGDQGDGTIRQLASIGINTISDTFIGIFGTTDSGNNRFGVYGASNSGTGVTGVSVSANGVSGTAATGVGVTGVASSSGVGLQGSSTSGWSLFLNGNSTKGHFGMDVLAGRPSNVTAGNFAFMYTTGGSTDARTGTPRLMYADGTDWRKVSDDTIWTG